MSLTNLALNLGYADFSAFSRAFNVWFGVSPTEFKTMKVINRSKLNNKQRQKYKHPILKSQIYAFG